MKRQSYRGGSGNVWLQGLWGGFFFERGGFKMWANKMLLCNCKATAAFPTRLVMKSRERGETCAPRRLLPWELGDYRQSSSSERNVVSLLLFRTYGPINLQLISWIFSQSECLMSTPFWRNDSLHFKPGSGRKVNGLFCNSFFTCGGFWSN